MQVAQHLCTSCNNRQELYICVMSNNSVEVCSVAAVLAGCRSSAKHDAAHCVWGTHAAVDHAAGVRAWVLR